MYIRLMNSVSTEHPVYLFSQASMYFPIYCSYFKSGIYLVLNQLILIRFIDHKRHQWHTLLPWISVFFFSYHCFYVICDLLLNGHMAAWNIVVNHMSSSMFYFVACLTWVENTTAIRQTSHVHFQPMGSSQRISA